MDLHSYDWIVINSSAGKDSQCMLTELVKLADSQGVPRERLVVVHADLGRMEWQGTKELAAAQAAFYRLRFEVVSRIGGTAKRDGKVYRKGETYGDILDYTLRRGKWPDSQNRWCTSDFKRGPIRTLWTRLVNETREVQGKGYQVRLLNCMGLRADESPARAKKAPFVHEDKLTNSKRHVDQWLPIHGYTTEQVWDVIEASGVPYHGAYDLGMPRLSCAFCIFAPKKALVLAGKHNPELLNDYVAVEHLTGHRFRMDVSMADVKDAVDAGEATDGINNWTM